MSMLSHQIEQLKDLRFRMGTLDKHNPTDWTLINGAIDTIESLSAKLSAANMERPEIYYGGRKQRAVTINIQIGNDDTYSDIEQLISETTNETNDKGYGVMNAIVDGEEVFSYKGFTEEFLKKCKGKE